MVLHFVRATALAHGSAPHVVEVLRDDASGPLLVRLSSGLGQRTASGFEYVCPSRWNGHASDLAAARRDGLTILATTKGVVTFEHGVFALHEMNAGARALGVSASGDLLFALLQRGEQYELVRVERDRLQTMFRDTSAWHTLSAADGFVQLTAMYDETLFQVLVSNGGVELGRDRAPAWKDTVLAESRALGTAAYIALTTDFGNAYALARLTNGELQPIFQGPALAGPVAATDGQAWIALGRKLFRFSNEEPIGVLDSTEVDELSCVEGRCYATVRDGLRALTDTALGPYVLRLTEIVEADLGAVSPERREACHNEWLDWKFDLVSAGLSTSADAVADAGAEAAVGATGVPATPMPSVDASAVMQPNMRDAPRLDAGPIDAGAAAERTSRGDGCSPVGRTRGGMDELALGALTLWLLRRRRQHPSAA